MKFNHHFDPGHSWIEVPYDLIDELGVSHKISGYSYRDRGTCYLEEDCDAPVFIDAWMTHYKEPKFPTQDVNHDGWNDPECFIRELPRYFVG